MSGITGIFRRDGQDVDPADIKKMNDKIAHRGPDGSHIWYEGPVALGHQMLHTTQESLHEILPFEDEESGLVITADARIDNRKDLAPRLGIEDNEYVSDSYFILKAYEKWGEKCPEELLGDFAFAIWDKNKEQLFCARDHMGVKPFYYYVSNNVFYFASEIKSILTFMENQAVNKLKIALYLKQVRTDKKFTFYKDIFALSAAHSVSIFVEDCFKRNYWKLDPNSKIIMDSDDEYFQAFLEIFFEAVKCRLRSKFPIGFDVSGGLDSSSIVCVARKILNDNENSVADINTFSQIYDDFPESDERFYIKKITEIDGIHSNFIKCDDISSFADITTFLWHQDQPFYNPFLPIFSAVLEKMQENSIRIRLAGIGGDVVVSHGSGIFLELFSSLKWKKLIFEISAYSKRMNKNFYNELLTKVLFHYIPKFLQTKLNLPWKYLKKVFGLNNSDNIFGEPKDFLNESFEESIDINSYLNKVSFLPVGKKNAAKNKHYNALSKISEQEDFQMMDHLGASFSIETRFPYWDKRVVEFCYAIPTEIKFRSGLDRFIVRGSMENILPSEIQWRPGKITLISILKRNILSSEKNLLEKMIYNNNELITNYMDIKSIKKVYDDFKVNNVIAYIHVLNMWQALLLNYWLEQIRLNSI